jgi:hypothetical protein
MFSLKQTAQIENFMSLKIKIAVYENARRWLFNHQREKLSSQCHKKMENL